MWLKRDDTNSFNFGTSPFAGAGSGSLESDALGYGDVETDANRDYAWRRWVNSKSPFLTKAQLQQLELSRGEFQSALSDAYKTNANARFGDILEGSDLLRVLTERQQPQRYLSLRHREG